MDVSLQSGARTLSKGLRTGSPGLAGLGALLLALVVIRRTEARSALVHRTTVRPGESLRVTLTKPATAPRRSS